MVRLVSIGASVFLFIVLVALGFCACLLPSATSTFAKQAENTYASLFSKDALVSGANATREYTFFSHDKHKLLEVIYEMNQGLVRENNETNENVESSKNSQTTLRGAPKIDVDADASALSEEELENTLLSANEKYVLTNSAISHLDDVYRVMQIVYPTLAIIFLLCVASFAHVIFYRGCSAAATPLIRSGIGVLLLLLLLGIWALIDFYGMFNALHSIIFSNNTWLFSPDSLLICMLPQDFWIKMGALWLSISTFGAILSIFCGVLLKNKPRFANKAESELNDEK